MATTASLARCRRCAALAAWHAFCRQCASELPTPWRRAIVDAAKLRVSHSDRYKIIVNQALTFLCDDSEKRKRVTVNA